MRISTSQLPPPSQWSEFEDLTHAVWEAELCHPNTRKNGRKGQEQQGVDVYGLREPKHWVGIQCKGKDNYSKKNVSAKELNEEVEKAKKFKPQLKEFILATTGPRDAKIQMLARELTVFNFPKNLFSVDVIFWEDMLLLLEKHPHIVPRFWPFLFQTGISDNTSNRKSEHLGKPSSDRGAAVRFGGIETKKLANEILNSLGIPPSKLKLLLSGRVTLPETKTKPKPILQTGQERRALSLVASAPPMFANEYYDLVFPDIDWSTLIPKFAKQGFVRNQKGKAVAYKKTRKILFADESAKEVFDKAWCAALEKHRIYPDVAFFFALVQMRISFSDSIETLAEVAIAMSPTSWNTVYKSSLEFVLASQRKDSLPKTILVNVFYGLARCCGRAREHATAVEHYDMMRELSTLSRNSSGVRHAFHGRGVELINLGRIDEAIDSFKSSIKRSRPAKDNYLLGRSLYHLAMCSIEKGCLASAERFLKESRAFKKRSKDLEGRLGTLFCLGRLAIAKSNFVIARKHYRKAASFAKRNDDFDNQALAELNIGIAYLQQGKPKDALKSFSKAIDLFVEWNPKSIAMSWAYMYRADANIQLGNIQDAMVDYKSEYDDQVGLGEMISAAYALHDVGLMEFKLRPSRKIEKSNAKSIPYGR